MGHTAGNGSEGRIVAGIDGSASSKEALRWASHQAELTGARVEAIMTWAVAPAAFPLSTPTPAADRAGSRAEEELAGIMSQIHHEFPSIKFSSMVREGWAARELVAAAQGADLLVVGSRGHGAVMGLLLGSVSEYCVTHGPCPVVVVHHGTDAVVAQARPVGPSSAGLTSTAQKGTTR
jgi:nucleotide-binding universal stress UspA family protein